MLKRITAVIAIAATLIAGLMNSGCENKAEKETAKETKQIEIKEEAENGKFVNAICFMRTYQYNGSIDYSNKSTLKSQMELYNEYGFPVTYLYEYDALINKGYRNVLDENIQEKDEKGLWFEIVKELCDEAGVKWKSRRNRNWDFYANTGFSIAYSKEEKEKLIDTAMNKFYEYYGEYPKIIGAWLMDSETMSYFAENYEITAFLLCREQYGTDGYTLWGAPNYSPYYPSKSNSIMPSVNENDKIDVPVIRFYVNDPIYSYYESLDTGIKKYNCSVFTEEATYPQTGQNKKWVEWMYEILFGEKSSGISYITIGQETPFGFGKELADALEMQIKYTLDNQEKYGYSITNISGMSEYIKKEPEKLNSNLKVALDDWGGNSRQSVWYNNKNYRINIYNHGDRIYIRDLQYYGKENRDQYLDKPCTTVGAEYFCLPVIDGLRFSANRESELAGLQLTSGNITDVLQTDNSVEIKTDRNLSVILQEEQITVKSDDGSDFKCEFKYSKSGCASNVIKEIEPTGIKYVTGTAEYRLNLEKGTANEGVFNSENGEIILSID